MLRLIFISLIVRRWIDRLASDPTVELVGVRPWCHYAHIFVYKRIVRSHHLKFARNFTTNLQITVPRKSESMDGRIVELSGTPAQIADAQVSLSIVKFLVGMSMPTLLLRIKCACVCCTVEMDACTVYHRRPKRPFY